MVRSTINRILDHCFFLLGFLLFYLVCSPKVTAANLIQLDISQVDVFLPEITIYASMTDDGESLPEPLRKEHLIARSDGSPVEILDVQQFKESGQGVAFTLLIDVSKTMAGRPFANAKKAVEEVISTASDLDRITIIAFGDDVKTVVEFSNDKNLLLSELEGIMPTHDNTHFFSAIHEAIKLNIRRDPTVPNRKAIFVITDGKDEGSGLIIEDLIRLHQGFNIPIYSIGFTNIEVEHLNNLKRLSDLSGGNFVRGHDAEVFSEIFQRTLADIQAQYIITSIFSEGRVDGEVHRILLTYRNGGGAMSSEKQVAFLYEKPPPLPINPVDPMSDNDTLDNEAGHTEVVIDNKVYWAFFAFCFLLLIFLIILRSRNRKIQESGSINGDTCFYENTGIPTSHPSLPVQEVANDSKEFSVNVQFFVLEGEGKGKQIPVSITTRGIILGRDGADVSFLDERVSRKHCSLSLEGNDKFILMDEGSRNGTFLNGIPVTSKEFIEDNDTLEIGKVKLRFKADTQNRG